METVFRISNCYVENQIMVFPLVLLLGKSALTWWNSHVRTVGHDVAYAMTWTDLKKKMTDKLQPTVFQELALMCVRMIPEESDKAEGTGARGLVHALGGEETDQDLNNMEDDISA
ncbi:hypothetical protein Tco_0690084 [Tanacetum coccineum]